MEASYIISREFFYVCTVPFDMYEYSEKVKISPPLNTQVPEVHNCNDRVEKRMSLRKRKKKKKPGAIYYHTCNFKAPPSVPSDQSIKEYQKPSSTF